MKFCLRSRQTKEYLLKADEIKVEYRDRKSIPDLAEWYPNATIILEIPPQTEWDTEEIRQYKFITKNRLIVAIAHLQDKGIPFLKEMEIPFYWRYEITTPYELNAIKNLGVCYVVLGAPLFFMQDVVAAVGIPGRIQPNISYWDNLPHENGTVGTWIRPEDLSLYENSIQAVEFFVDDNHKEQALYRIYAEQHKWPGPLDLIIENLGVSPTNRMLPQEITLHRLNCGQRCEAGKPCRLCYRYFSLANEEKMRAYRDEVLNKNGQTNEE